MHLRTTVFWTWCFMLVGHFLASGQVAKSEPHIEWESIFPQLSAVNYSAHILQRPDRGYILARPDSFVIDKTVHTQIEVYRLADNGDIDDDWRPNPVQIRRDRHQFLHSLDLTTDGGVVIAGYSAPSGPETNSLIAYKMTSDGELDGGWIRNPWRFTVLNTSGSNAYAFEHDDGGYVVCGSGRPPERPFSIVIAKLREDGELDSDWDTNPRLYTGDHAFGINSVYPSSDGGILLVGTGGNEVFAMKLDAVGELDPSWTDNPFSHRRDLEYQVVSGCEVPGGSGYALVGHLYRSTFERFVQITRLDCAGQLDSSWLDNPRSYDILSDATSSFVSQTLDGGLIVTGEINTGGDTPEYHAFLAKFRADGNVDSNWRENPLLLSSDRAGSGDRVVPTFDGGYVLTAKDFSGNRHKAFKFSRDPSLGVLEPMFLRGDCNDDGTVDISDAVCILNWLFLGGEIPACVAATNTNGDAGEDISDAVYVLTHLFLGGSAPVAPFPDCGTSDLQIDQKLGCKESSCP